MCSKKEQEMNRIKKKYLSLKIEAIIELKYTIITEKEDEIITIISDFEEKMIKGIIEHINGPILKSMETKQYFNIPIKIHYYTTKLRISFNEFRNYKKATIWQDNLTKEDFQEMIKSHIVNLRHLYQGENGMTDFCKMLPTPKVFEVECIMDPKPMIFNLK